MRDLARKEELGQEAIAVYKALKGATQIVAAVVIGGLLATHHDAWLYRVAEALRHHGLGAWAVKVASFLTPHHVELTAAALLLDGIVTSVEGWALRRRHAWGPWLVVGTTSLLVPFEIVEIARQPHVPRTVLLVLNLAIVAFLAHKALREHRARRAALA